ncbi:MAG: FimV/HubP family polar landmark protein [Woeseiaceae bacterium]
MKVYRLSMLLILLLPPIFAAAPAQGAEMLTDPGGAGSATGNFHLKGVLVSDSGGLALINGKMSRVGDRVAGAEILAIVEGAVRLLIGSRELTVNVGSSFDTQQTFHASTGRSQRESRPESVRASNRPMEHRPTEHRPTQPASSPSRVDQHAVTKGETLSGISKHYQVDGVTLNQMMIAFFRINPKAFDDNINILLEGASLRIPTRSELLQEEADMATAQVSRQIDEWQTVHQQPARVAEAVSRTHYGPVDGGETLIVIAENVRPVGVTVDQMMIALFEANPEAFGDNINMLYEGSVLHMPDNKELLQRPEIATAEVTRQMDAWLSDDRRAAQSALPYADMTAASH